MTLPKISIITPSFNQANYLERTILSVISQNYPNFEYIIMDGGSTDNSVEIIKKYEKHLTYWQSEEDGGQAVAIARGFNICSGEIIGWLNSDDLLMPGCLGIIAKEYESREYPDVISGRCIYIDEMDSPFSVHVPFKRSVTAMLILGHGLAQMATFWKRHTYEAVGGIDISMKFAFDYDLFVKMNKYGSLEIVREYLAAFRVHSLSKTSTIHNISILEDQTIIRKYLSFVLRMGMPIFPLLHRLDPLRRLRNNYVWRKHNYSISEIIKELKKIQLRSDYNETMHC